MLNSYAYNQAPFNSTISTTHVKTATSKAYLAGEGVIAPVAMWSAGNIFNTTERTSSSKGDIQHFGVTRTATSKGNISVKMYSTSRGRVGYVGVTNTATSKAYTLSVAQGRQPRLSTIEPEITLLLLPFPNKATMQLVEIEATVDTLAYETEKHQRGYKYEYTFHWDVMSVDKYDALEDLVELEEPLYFAYTKWEQTNEAVNVLAELGTRNLVAGTGSQHFWSSVDLTLTEVDPR